MNPIQSFSVSKPDGDEERSHSRTSSVNSVLTKMNDTILDNIVNRFSLVDNHKVRGKWRAVMSLMVISFPVTVFVVMMWYSLYKACVPSQVVFMVPVKHFIQNFLASDGIHYCSTAVTKFNAASYYNYYSGESNFCCYLTGVYSSFNFNSQCSSFADLFSDCSMSSDDGSTCYDANAPITIYYSQCTSINTAIVLSGQYAIYATVVSIYFYFFLRVCKKYGAFGLLKWDSWSKVMNNKDNWVEKPASEIV